MARESSILTWINDIFGELRKIELVTVKISSFQKEMQLKNEISAK